MKELELDTHFIHLRTDYEVPTKELVGNKGANLARMMDLGIMVPDTVVVTVAGAQFIAENGADSIDFEPLKKLCAEQFGYYVGVSIRSSGVVSMAGMLETIHMIEINSRSFDTAISDVIDSWNNPKAKLYRKIKKMDDTPQIAVVIQPTIVPNEEHTGSGIMFTRNPNTGEDEMIGEFLPEQLGTRLADGEEGGVSLSTLPTDIQTELSDIGEKLEGEFKDVMDIEFVIDDKRLYIVQCRVAKLTPTARVRTMLDFVKDGTLLGLEFALRFNVDWLKECFVSKAQLGAELMSSGLGAVGGIVSGTIVTNAEEAKKYDNPILVADITTTEDLDKIIAVNGLITSRGGMTSHPAITCRELNKPCVTNLGDISMFKTGMVVTVDGDEGVVYAAEVEITKHNPFEKQAKELLSAWGEK